MVALEIERRGWDFGYATTSAGYEVDFAARDHEGAAWAIQVVSDPTTPGVLERELRALQDLRAGAPSVRCLLLTLNEVDATTLSRIPAQIATLPVWQWCLQGEER